MFVMILSVCRANYMWVLQLVVLAADLIPLSEREKIAQFVRGYFLATGWRARVDGLRIDLHQ
jgi:hypothetical protein